MNILKFILYIRKELFFVLIAGSLSAVLIPIIFVNFSLAYQVLIPIHLNSITSTSSELYKFIEDNYEILKIIFFLTSSIFLFQPIHFISSIILAKSLPSIAVKLKRLALNHCLSLPLSYFKEKNSADIERNVANFSESFCSILESSVNLLSRCVTILSCLSFCFKVKVLLLSFVLWIVITFSVGIYFFKKINKLSSIFEQKRSENSGFAAEIFDHIISYKFTNTTKTHIRVFWIKVHFLNLRECIP